MKKKIAWLVVSCLMVAALVLASCAPAEKKGEVITPKEEVVTPKEEAAVPKEEVVTPKEEVVTPAVEVPKYGGVLNIGASSSPTAFDMCYSATGGYMGLWSEDLFGGDWARGPAGTGEISHQYTVVDLPETASGRVAESIEMPDPDTMVVHIRKGVYFQNKPPVNGRQVDANDVVYNLLRMWNQTGTCPRAYLPSFLPWVQNVASIEATDKWTVIVKTLPGRAGVVYEVLTDFVKILPPEAIKQFGDMNDWRNTIGTGPFIFTDFVRDSSATFGRNPNYWMTDPVGPGKGNQLPYLGGVKYIIMPDISTQMAALRTAKIDHLSGVKWEDAARFKKDSPEMKYVRVLGSGTGIFMRVDKPELPFYDKKVRQALALAVNQPEIAKTYYGGEADVYSYPVTLFDENMPFYIPFEELPKSAQELFEYYPDKAKQLLAEAGYPNGFKTEVVALSTEVDLLSIIKAYWAGIGVDLKIDVKESAVKTSIGWLKTHKEMFYSGFGNQIPSVFDEVRSGHFANYSMVNDKRVDEAETQAFGAQYFDMEKRSRIVRDITPYLLDQAWLIALPGPYTYTFWQPWLKNYHGELSVGTWDGEDWARWAWIDQDLKEKMTGRR